MVLYSRVNYYSALFAAALLLCAIPLSAQSPDSSAVESGAEKFDPSRDPTLDVDNAIVDAKLSNRRILLDVGGEWCKWCHYLDRFFEQNKDVTEFLHKKYVVVKVNYSKENENKDFLGQFPKITGYPHLFVLDSDGTFIYSQDTGELESGQGHDHDKVLAFLKKWASN
jgi:thioredoxin-related protein